MPVLKLTDGEGRFVEFAPLHLFAIMAYPKEHDTRADWLFAELALTGIESTRGQISGESKTAAQLDVIELAAHRNLSGLGREKVREESTDLLAKGSVAGWVLLFALRCGLWKREH